MAKTIAELKKARGNTVADLQKQVEKLNKTWEKDERLWQPTADKAGTGSAVIRFLPAPKGEDLPWVRKWSHSFQGPTGKWYIENSLTTLDQADPVSELNSELWNSGDAGKEVARKQKRKLEYISNILVVSDPGNPQNEGKVFLYKYGKKIFDKIKDAMNPPKEFADEKEMDPFDFWEGADFKLKFRKVDGYRNYDKSEFKEPSEVSESDAQIQEIWDAEYSLQEFLDPKNYKPYDELKKKLQYVLKGGPVGTSAGSSSSDDDDEDVLPPRKSAKALPIEEEDEEIPAPKSKAKAKAAAPVEEEDEAPKAKSKKKAEPEPKAKSKPKKAEPVEEEDDILDHFASLAADDDE